MRVPLSTDLISRDGTLAKDPQLRNAYVFDGEVVKRPGADDLGLFAVGQAQLLVRWPGLFSVIGDTLRSGLPPGTSAGSFSPKVANQPMTAEVSAAGYEKQQLLIKTSDQLWVYTV